MGGPGSGSHYHWWRRAKKTTVEQCQSLDSGRWRREGILKEGAHSSGTWTWTYRGGDSSSIDYTADLRDPARASVRLTYSWVWRGTGQRDSASYAVALTATRPRFGGLRWWFVCPLVVNGVACGRRVGKLYLPPGSRYFGCRHCHGLTYTSCQEHDKRVDALLSRPGALDSGLEDLDGADLGQVLRATNPTLKAQAQLLRRTQRLFDR